MGDLCVWVLRVFVGVIYVWSVESVVGVGMLGCGCMCRDECMLVRTPNVSVKVGMLVSG